jgi:hypothetical protein
MVAQTPWGKSGVVVVVEEEEEEEEQPGIIHSSALGLAEDVWRLMTFIMGCLYQGGEIWLESRALLGNSEALEGAAASLPSPPVKGIMHSMRLSLILAKR